MIPNQSNQVFLYTISELRFNADCKSAASNFFSFVNDMGYKGRIDRLVNLDSGMTTLR